jgi:hypothetical protein
MSVKARGHPFRFVALGAWDGVEIDRERKYGGRLREALEEFGRRDRRRGRWSRVAGRAPPTAVPRRFARRAGGPVLIRER